MYVSTSKEDDGLQAQQIIPISLHLQSSSNYMSQAGPWFWLPNLLMCHVAVGCGRIHKSRQKSRYDGGKEGAHIGLVGDQMLVGH